MDTCLLLLGGPHPLELSRHQFAFVQPIDAVRAGRPDRTSRPAPRLHAESHIVRPRRPRELDAEEVPRRRCMHGQSKSAAPPPCSPELKDVLGPAKTESHMGLAEIKLRAHEVRGSVSIGQLSEDRNLYWDGNALVHA